MLPLFLNGRKNLYVQRRTKIFILSYSSYVLESFPIESRAENSLRASVNIFKHFRLYSFELHYRNINKRKFDKKFRIEQIFYRVVAFVKGERNDGELQ